MSDDQWTPEERELLRNREAPGVVFKRIQSKIDYLLNGLHAAPPERVETGTIADYKGPDPSSIVPGATVINLDAYRKRRAMMKAAEEMLKIYAMEGTPPLSVDSPFREPLTPEQRADWLSPRVDHIIFGSNEGCPVDIVIPPEPPSPRTKRKRRPR